MLNNKRKCVIHEISGKKAHVHDVIILKRMANHISSHVKIDIDDFTDIKFVS